MLEVKSASVLGGGNSIMPWNWSKDGTLAVFCGFLFCFVLLVFNTFRQHCEVPGWITMDNNQKKTSFI